MCRTLGVARRGCCRWAKRPTSAHDLRDLELAKLIGGEHEAGMGVYGAPKVFMRLKTSGVATSRKRVARIMRGSGWKGVAGPARSVPRREACRQAGLPWRPGQARLRRRRPRQGPVRRHRLRARARAGPASQ